MNPGRAWPDLVGRADELHRLEAALAAAADARGSTVLIHGEAGIGKTRLVSELVRRAHGIGATVLSGRCIDLVGSGMPYLPLVEALRPLRGSPALVEIGPLLPELSRLVPELTQPPGHAAARPGHPDSRLRLFEETLALMEHLAAAAPVVVVLDDLHWADRSTLDLVSFLAHAARERRLLLVATYRSGGEVEPDSHLRRLVAELQRAREATAMALEPFERDEVARLLGGIAKAPVPAGLADEIYERSEGNPFFAEELFAVAGRGEEAVPPALRDVLLQRLDGLDGETRSLLRAAAAAGRDVPYRLLAAVESLSEARLVELLRGAVEHAVLVPDQRSGSFRFRHALLAEAVYTTLLPGEREELHARLARALIREPSLAVGSLAAELATHWEAAGKPIEALNASIEAARDAQAVSGPMEAHRHLERALDLWPRVEDPESTAGLDLGAVLAQTAEVAYFAGAGERAPELMRQAISMADQDDAARLGLLYERLGTFLLPIGDHAGASVAYATAVELVPEQPPSHERVRVLAALGNALLLSWRPVESRATCEQALAVAAVIGDDRPALRALSVLGVDLQLLGFGAEGVACLLDARRRAREQGMEVEELRTYVMLSDVYLMGGQLHEAARDALEGVAKARRLGYERSSGIVMAANAAEALLGLGDWLRAAELLDAAQHSAGRFRPEGVQILRAELELRRGKFQVARAHLEAARQAALEPQSSAAYACLVAELALMEQRPEEATMAIDRALRSDTPGDLQIRAPRLCALALRAETELAQVAAICRDVASVGGARRRAKDLLEHARRSAADAAAVTPEAASWLTVAEAEHSRVQGRSRPELWESAVAAWDRLERPYLAAYCRWRHAEALLISGSSRRDAAVPAREAHKVARKLGARPLETELELLAQRARLDFTDRGGEEQPDPKALLGLTPREREVLQLLGRGYNNREVATELTISIKTASVHVSHILRKLDVSNRLEAARIAHQLARPPSTAPDD